MTKSRSGHPAAPGHVLAAAHPSGLGTVLAAVEPAGLVVCDTVSDVRVLAVSGQLDQVAPQLDRAILHALADEPRGVVCDLSGVVDGVEPNALELLATSGRRAKEWPGTPVAITCPDPDIRVALRLHPISDHVMIRPTLGRALSDVAKLPVPDVARTTLAPHVTASRAARSFVARACLDWGLRHAVASATLVVSELVTNAVLHAVSHIDLSLSHQAGTLRLAVRDRSSQSPRHREGNLERTTGRGLALVEGFARTWGILPTAEGGKVVWAVLDV